MKDEHQVIAHREDLYHYQSELYLVHEIQKEKDERSHTL
jgi:hypothetical protein